MSESVDESPEQAKALPLWQRPWVLLSAAVAFVFLVVIVGSAVHQIRTPINVSGTVHVTSRYAEPNSSGGCSGVAYYQYIYEGATVTVEPWPNSHGRSASGELSNARTAGYRYGGCSFDLSVSGVPSGFDEYVVRIGDIKRVLDEEELSELEQIEFGE